MKIVKLFFLFIIIVLIGSVIYLSYLGFMPFISSAIGVTKPKDLGIKYDLENYNAYIKKAKTDIQYLKTNSVNPLDSIKASGIKNIKDSFTQQEISARLNYSKWKYLPVDNTQVKINQDDTVEFSGNLLIDRLPGFAEYTGFGKLSNKDIDKGMSYLSLLKINPPVYLKFEGKLIHNYPTLKIHAVEIGKFSVPLEKLGANLAVTQAIKNVFLRTAGLHAMSLTFTNGQMNFDGTVPARIEVESE